jgi:hypothetical protein
MWILNQPSSYATANVSNRLRMVQQLKDNLQDVSEQFLMGCADFFLEALKWSQDQTPEKQELRYIRAKPAFMNYRYVVLEVLLKVPSEGLATKYNEILQMLVLLSQQDTEANACLAIQAIGKHAEAAYVELLAF